MIFLCRTTGFPNLCAKVLHDRIVGIMNKGGADVWFRLDDSGDMSLNQVMCYSGIDYANGVRP